MIFPGSNAIHERSSSQSITVNAFDFVIKSGRAVVHPIYKSTYEREDSLKSDYADSSYFYRDHVIMWAKDLRRTLFEPCITTKRGGWGIGLALARRVVEDAHQGALLLEPTERGACFLIRMPLAEQAG